MNLQQTTFRTKYINYIRESWIDNIVNKWEITHHDQFILLQQCLQKSSVADASTEISVWERVQCQIWEIGQFNPFPHTTILQQTTLNVSYQKVENLYNWMDNLWLKVENIVAKGEIARFVQFLLLSLCFQKAVCCRGVRKRLYEKLVGLN